MTLNELKKAIEAFEAIHPDCGDYQIAVAALGGHNFTTTKVNLLAPPMMLDQGGVKIPVVTLAAFRPEPVLTIKDIGKDALSVSFEGE